MNANNQSWGVSLSGSPAAVAAVRAALAAARGPAGVDPDAPAPACANGCNGAQVGGGALAAQTDCNTRGSLVRMCAAGTFVAYTQQAPLFVVKTPTRRDFDVPCAVALDYFAQVATKCRSANSLMTTVTLGQGVGACNSTQIQAVTAGNTAQVTISAEDGCELFTPGLLLSVGFSDNTPPGPVSMSVSAVGSDGCSVLMEDIRVMMQSTGTGTLALLFGCNEEQRLYPVIARLRSNNVLLPSGTTLPGLGAISGPLYNPDETIVVNVTGPAGMTLTVETLTWNHPTLSCLWVNALSQLGL